MPHWGARLYHFFPGRPAFERATDAKEICPVTNEPQRCSVLITRETQPPARPLVSGPRGMLGGDRTPPVVARAWSVGCVCRAEAAVVEVTGRLAGSGLDDLLVTIEMVRSQIELTSIWVELRAVLLPGRTDADRHIDVLTDTLFSRLGADVPLHLTAVGPSDDDERRALLQHARWIAVANGLRWVYTDDATDPSARCTWCPGCDALLIDHREEISRVVGVRAGQCVSCGWAIPGHFPVEALAA